MLFLSLRLWSLLDLTILVKILKELFLKMKVSIPQLGKRKELTHYNHHQVLYSSHWGRRTLNHELMNGVLNA